MAGLSYTIVPKANVRIENLFGNLPTLFSQSDKLVLAPMQGLTSLFFRKAYSECFPNTIDYAISPFISLTSGEIEKSKRKFRDVEPKANETSLRVVPQLLGNNSEDMIKYAQRLFSMGYTNINLNLACPAKCAVKHRRGAALLKDYKEVDVLLDRVVGKITPSLSVKIRLGYDSTEQLSDLISVLNSYPLHSVIVHPRTAVQLYEGDLDFEAMESIEKRLRHKIVYNGGIFSVENFNQIKSRFPQINHFMIGRGLLSNPLLAAQIRGLNYDSSLLYTFFLKLQQYYKEDFLQVGDVKEMSKTAQCSIAKAVLDKSKEFSKYLFPNRFNQLSLCKDIEELNSNVSRMFQEYYGLDTCRGT